jgi:predicted ATP-grasp superfamily ATP-dependent carboligase
MRILITDGNERVALAAARSLVRAGQSVTVTAPMRWSLAGVSRCVRSRVVQSEPLADPQGYAAEVARIARVEASDLLLPMTDASLEAVLEHRDAFPSQLAIPAPDLATYRRASDKAQMLELARACGFDAPLTQRLEGRGAPEAGLFPAFLKPHRSVVGTRGKRQKMTVVPVADAARCDAVLATLPADAYPVLLQRQVVGSGEGLFVLRWNGRIVAMFAHRRLREKPPSGGVSVYRESIPLSEELVGPGLRLLEALEWQGVAMIECKRDAASGRYVLMEVNGRFWGSLQLAIDAGVDFPALLARCVAGEDVPPSRDYRIGVRSRWFWGDVDNLLLSLRDGGGGRSRFGAVRDFLRASLRLREGEIWRWRDPLPFAVETLQWIGVLTRDTAGARRKSRAVPRESVPGSAVP